MTVSEATIRYEAEQTITRFDSLFATRATPGNESWSELFQEFSKKSPFLGKDNHPGWSPAVFDPPQRAKENVRTITALVLDYDNKTPNGQRVDSPITVEDATEMFGDYFGHIHTTKSHTQEWPKFRVVLPLTRPVPAADYPSLWQAAAQRWPGLDPQPKDSSRFWFAPGVTEGADFESRELRGAFLDPAELTVRPKTLEPASVPATADDSQEKRARAYVAKMPPAISGAGGHAATFAVARKLIWGFRLDEYTALRILREDYNPRCEPPWPEQDLVHKIRQAVDNATDRTPVEDRPQAWSNSAAIAAQQAQPVHQSFVVPKADEWKKFLRHDARANLTKDQGNVSLLIKNSEPFEGCLKYDLLARRVFWAKVPPIDVGIGRPKAGDPLADHHLSYIQHVLVTQYNLSGLAKDMVWSAVDTAAHECPVHPVQEYLNGLVWDGTPRLDTMLSVYFGAKQTPYTAAVGRKFPIAAVARAFEPGCQCDYMPVFEGSQGKGKDQALKALMHNRAWYSETSPDLNNKTKTIENLQGSWFVSWGEMDTLSSARITQVKDFITTQVDKYRTPYARNPEVRPRSCVFVGTTNEKAYLNDPTGARRFWPVDLVGRINVAAIARDRDALWAEAKFYYDSGEEWFLNTPELEALATVEQDERTTRDAREEIIREWLMKPWLPGARGEPDYIDRTGGITVSQIALGALKVRPQDVESVASPIGKIMRRIGWTRVQNSKLPGSPRFYFPPEAVTGTE